LSILRKVLCCFLAIGLLLAFPGFASADETDKFTQVKSGKFSRVIISPNFKKDQTVFAFKTQGGESHWGGYTELLRSQDGGNTWARVDWVVDERYRYTDDIWIGDMAFAEDGTIYLTGVFKDSDDQDAEYKNFLYKSRENGDRWETVTNDLGENHLICIIPVGDKMLGVTDQGVLKLSTDGGTSWNQQVKALLSRVRDSVAVLDENTYWVVLDDGEVWRTNDEGGDWNRGGLLLTSGSFATGRILAVPGSKNGPTLLAYGDKEGDFHVTRDGGSHWKQIGKENLKWPEYSSDRITCGAGLTDGIIIAGTSRGFALVSENSGDYWVPVKGMSGEVVDISAVNVNDTVVIFGATGEGIYRADYHVTPSAPIQQPDEQPTDGDEPEQPDVDEQPEPEQPATGDVKFFIGLTKYMVGDELHHMDARPFIEKDRTYVPVRYLALSLGIPEKDIRWNDEKKEVTLVKDGSTLSLTVGKYIMYLDGFPRGTPVAPVIRGDRTYLPARFVVEAFNYEASWDQTERTVTVIKQAK
jgi:photosystem II stability/assembly factor-like uncharacterized protein